MFRPTMSITGLLHLCQRSLSSKTWQSLVVILFALVLRSTWTRQRNTRRLLHDLGAAGSPLGSQKEAEYDIIVVGGGTAGCVLASRLSENPSTRVLLLEAGQSALSQILSRIPSGYGLLFRTEHDYNLYTIPQDNAKGRVWYWPRAKLLGGCSALNAMMYHYGAPSDYDEWASITGDKGWSYDQFIRYFHKYEKYCPNSKHPLVSLSNRGVDGLVSVGHSIWTSPMTHAFVEACKMTGIPVSLDVNTSTGSLGATRIMTYIDQRGERVTTESAYLTADVLRRPNLTVVVGARATRILMKSIPGREPRAAGVEFTGSVRGQRFRAHARREVVLAAGAVHTPQLLMISGIGPAEHLSKHGIPLHVNLPGVGSHLQDHITVNTLYRDISGASLSFLRAPGFMNVVRRQWAILKWLATGGGPLGTNLAEGAAFARTTDQSLFRGEDTGDTIPEDTASGPNAPDVEFIFTTAGYKEHGFGPIPPGDLIGIQAVLLRPKSEGSIRLASTSIFDAPLIDPQYLTAPNDIITLVRGMRLALKIARAPPLAERLDPHETDPELGHHLHEADDAYLMEVIRDRAETLYHPCCTARMAPLEDEGVVNSRLQVYGVHGLRIADASVFPRIVAGHTTAPCISIAEKCADMIREDLNDCETNLA